MSVYATGNAAWPHGPRRHETPSIGLRSPPAAHEDRRCGGVMNRRLPTWMILAGGTALAAAGFFASTGITHWVMGLRHTDVVIRPGPTIYLPSPTGHHHAHHRVPPASAPAEPMYGGGVPSRQDADGRPDHRGDHPPRHHKGDHARQDYRGNHARLGNRRRHPQGSWPGAAHHHGGEGRGHARAPYGAQVQQRSRPGTPLTSCLRTSDLPQPPQTPRCRAFTPRKSLRARPGGSPKDNIGSQNGDLT